MNTWVLPKTAKIGEKEYNINTDFRDVLEIIQYLNDLEKTEQVRWMIAISLFYEGDIRAEDMEQAARYLAEFISYGIQSEKKGPVLLSWEQDAQMIVADINKVAGKEIRNMEYLHWWTFLSYFYGIGEGQLSTVVSIRSKLKSGKKLEKWEQEYYRENRSRVDMKDPETKEKKQMQEYFDKWL